jgi:hypothetical protein
MLSAVMKKHEKFAFSAEISPANSYVEWGTSKVAQDETGSAATRHATKRNRMERREREPHI